MAKCSVHCLQAAFNSGLLLEGRSILVPYLKYVAQVVRNAESRIVEPSAILRGLNDRYGIEMTLPIVQTVIKIGISEHLIERTRDNSLLVRDELFAKYDFDTAEFEKKWEILCRKYCDFLKENKVVISDNDISSLIFESIDGSVFANENEGEDVKEPTENKFWWTKFIDSIHKDSCDLFDFVCQVSLCNIITEAQFHNADEKSTNKFGGLTVYLDTPIAIALLGFDDNTAKVNLCKYLVEQLRTSGVNIAILDNCYNELYSVFQSAQEWVGAPLFHRDMASPVARYCFDNRMSSSEILNIKEGLAEDLKQYGVAIVDAGYDPDANSAQIDERTLTDLLRNIYASHGRELSVNAERQISVDIRSIAMVYRLRKNYTPKHLYDSRHLLLTFNGALSTAAAKYSRFTNEMKPIPPCITVDALGTVLWFYSPKKISQYKRLLLLSDCYSATRPSRALMESFRKKLEICKKDGRISEEQFLRCSVASAQDHILYDCTHGRVCNLDENSVLDIIRRIEQEDALKLSQEIDKVRSEERAKADEEKAQLTKQMKSEEENHRDEIAKKGSLLDEKERLLCVEKGKNDDANKMISELRLKQEKRDAKLDRLAAGLSTIVVSALVVIGSYYTVGKWCVEWSEIKWGRWGVALISFILANWSKCFRLLLKPMLSKILSALFN